MSDYVRNGIHPQLEAEANDLIFGSLRGVTSQSAKSDVLTPWKEQDRRAREVLSSIGTVDPAIRRGMFRRCANTRQPHLNALDGVVKSVSRTRAPSFEDDWPSGGRT